MTGVPREQRSLSVPDEGVPGGGGGGGGSSGTVRASNSPRGARRDSAKSSPLSRSSSYRLSPSGIMG